MASKMGNRGIYDGSVSVDLKTLNSDATNLCTTLRWSAKFPEPTKICTRRIFFAATSGGWAIRVIFAAPTGATGYYDLCAAKPT